MRTIYGSLVLGIFLAACGGGSDTQKPAEAPPAPTVAPPAPTTAEPAPSASAPAPAKPSMQDMQKALVASALDALNAHDPAKFAAGYTDDATLVVAGAPEPFKGKDTLQGLIKKTFDTFANSKWGISRAWAAKDVLAVEWVVNGTQNGEFMGKAGTEKPVGVTGLSIMWLNDDGKVKEEHRYSDDATIFAQIGAAPKGMKARAIPAIPSSTEWHWAKGDDAEAKGISSAKDAYAAFEKKDDKAFAAMNADDVTWDDMMGPAPTKGKAEAVKMFKAFTGAFPDLKMQATNVWGVEDFAIAEVTTTGTQKGAFMGMPATGKSVTLHGVDVVQVKDGKAVKGWSYGNGVEMLMQMGIMKAPGAAKADAKKGDAKASAPKGDAKKDAPKGDAKKDAPKK